jgi:hypothetical protein
MSSERNDMEIPQRPDVEVFVSPRILGETFNGSQIPKQIEHGELIPRFLRNAYLNHPEQVGEAWCTRGQMIRYLDDQGTLVVEVFQYMRSDGSLGASGRPDPKRMRIRNEIWIAELD